MGNKTISLILLSFLITTNSFGNENLILENNTNNNNFHILKQSKSYETNKPISNEFSFIKNIIFGIPNNSSKGLSHKISSKNNINNRNNRNINNSLNNNLDININKKQNTNFDIEGYLEKCEEKLSNKEIELKRADDWTSLMCAARINDVRGVHFFIFQEGKSDKSNYTALMHAAVKGNGSCIQILIAKEKFAMQNNFFGTTLMFPAGAFCGVFMTTKELGMRNNTNETALILAAKNGHKNVVELLMNTRELGMRNNLGETALMCAAKNCHIEIVELLMNTRELGIRNNFGETALVIAERFGNMECTELLRNTIQAESDNTNNINNLE